MTGPGPQPPMQLGDALDADEFRRAARTLLERRSEANRNYAAQVAISAKANGDYEKIKSTRYLEIKNLGGADEGSVSAAEAGERVKGDGAVQIALIARDTATGTLRARLEDIRGCDEALSTLRRVADWSQSLEMRGT